MLTENRTAVETDTASAGAYSLAHASVSATDQRVLAQEALRTVAAFANCQGGRLYVDPASGMYLSSADPPVSPGGCLRAEALLPRGIPPDRNGQAANPGVHFSGMAPPGIEISDSLLQRYHAAIQESVCPDPTPFVDFSRENREGRELVCITVSSGSARPYFLQGKGYAPDGVYVRKGGATVPASAEEIRGMLAQTGSRYETTRALQQKLTFYRTGAFFEKHRMPLDAHLMESLHMLGPDGTYTNLAWLLSDQCTHTIKMTVFGGGAEGQRNAVLRDRLETSGSLLGQMEEAYAFMMRYNPTRKEGSDKFDTTGQEAYPPDAVREALINAVVHRDYGWEGATLIRIFPDRMEFTTIGGLVQGISFEDIRLGISLPRNPHLANVFYRLGLMECAGCGMAQMQDCYAYTALRPSIMVSDNAFRLTLPNRYESAAAESATSQYTNLFPKEGGTLSKESELLHGMRVGQPSFRSAYSVGEESIHESAAPVPRDKRVKAITALCRKNGSIVRADVQQVLGISQPTAILLLRKLVEEGVLEKTGDGNKVRYRLGRSGTRTPP